MKLTPPPEEMPGLDDRVVVIHEGQALGAGRVVAGQQGGPPLAVLDWLEWRLPPRGHAWVIPGNLAARLRAALPVPLVESPIGPTGSTSRPTTVPACTHPTVTAVAAAGGTQRVRLDAMTATGVGIGDRLDLYRGIQYVGFAKVETITSTTVELAVLPSLSAGDVQAGDTAIRRPPAGSIPPPMGYVFRCEADYVLVSLGEADGIARGDHLSARAADGRPYRLRVDRTYPDHCGASLERDDPELLAKPARWDRVRPAAVGAPSLVVAVPATAAQSTESPWLLRVTADALPPRIRPGDFVILSNRPDDVGVILVAAGPNVFVYRPGFWKNPSAKAQPDD
ncbi:MAG: hypothetical protein GY778_31295 [bacterium]|nr:hypothetical protein [bacterium]